MFGQWGNRVCCVVIFGVPSSLPWTLQHQLSEGDELSFICSLHLNGLWHIDVLIEFVSSPAIFKKHAYRGVCLCFIISWNLISCFLPLSIHIFVCLHTWALRFLVIPKIGAWSNTVTVESLTNFTKDLTIYDSLSIFISMLCFMFIYIIRGDMGWG